MLVAYETCLCHDERMVQAAVRRERGQGRQGSCSRHPQYSRPTFTPLGQFIQDGSNVLFETVVHIAKAQAGHVFLKDDAGQIGDGLNFLSNQNMSVVNQQGLRRVLYSLIPRAAAPNMVLEMPEVSLMSVASAISSTSLRRACAVSGYLLGVNPFNQPGVESYKKNMFALLGKPGYEDAKAALEAKIG